MPYKDKSSRIFLITLFYNFIIACFFLLSPEEIHVNMYFFSSFISILILCYSVKHTKRWISVVNLFIVIWMIFVPLSCGEHPMMSPMTSQEILWVVFHNILFSFGGLFASAFRVLNKGDNIVEDNIENDDRIVLKPNTYVICIWLLVLSIAIAVVLFVLKGIPIFSIDSNNARNAFYSIPGSSLLHNLGIPINFLIFCDKEKRKSKLFISLLVIYLITLLFTGARFTIIINLIMLATVMEKSIQKKMSWKKVVLFPILVVIAFYAITSVRGGTADKEAFFVSTGLYKGSAKDLVITEAVRYFGMPQRLMGYFINKNDISTNGALTFFPYVRFFVNTDNLSFKHSIYGYNAINVLAYLWCDFKWGMWPMIFVLAAICQRIYIRFLQQPNDLFRTYFWSVAAFAIVLSFYCYTYSYPYWLLEYPILIWIIKLFNENRLRFRGK